MRVKLSENIKKFRKERKMTQEQFAEVMGVSVSAVYKWESNQSTPEINLILEMADLFHTSTDVLLGYEWRNASAASSLDRIATLAEEKAYGEAITEAEKALKSYPNNFDIVYRSALLYLKLGKNAEHLEANRRAIELLEHACALIAQNQDETVSEVSIRTQMAKAHLLLHDPDTALRILKKYNVCGINNVLIGMVLSDCLHDADGAEKYLRNALSTFAEDINYIMIGYANVFFQRKDYDTAIDCIRWLRTVLRGIQPEETLTWFDKYDCVLLEILAELYCIQGDFEKTRQFLSEAASHAVTYDHAAPGEVAGIEFFTMLGIERQPTYDEYGKTAVECLHRRIQKESDEIPQLYQLWRETINEVLPPLP